MRPRATSAGPAVYQDPTSRMTTPKRPALGPSDLLERSRGAVAGPVCPGGAVCSEHSDTEAATQEMNEPSHGWLQLQGRAV